MCTPCLDSDVQFGDCVGALCAIIRLYRQNYVTRGFLLATVRESVTVGLHDD